jgi:hypothetical protein
MNIFRLTAAARLALVCLILVRAAVPADPRQAESKRASRDVPVDADPQSDFWRSAPTVFLENDSRGNPVPGYRTEVRSRWTAGNLYFLFICPYTELNLKPDPKIDVETNKLWTWDVAEAFIGTDFQNIRKYKEFEVSPQGEWVDLDIDLDAPHHEDGWTWNSGFQTAARIDRAKSLWYAIMRIPYSSVDTRGAAAGNLLRINFYLSEGPRTNHKALAWQPTQKPTFHVPEAFGTLKLVP